MVLSNICSGETMQENTDNVIELDMYRPHTISKVICLKCYRRWICARPDHTMLEDIECKNCGPGYVIETGELLDFSDEEVDFSEE